MINGGSNKDETKCKTYQYSLSVISASSLNVMCVIC